MKWQGFFVKKQLYSEIECIFFSHWRPFTRTTCNQEITFNLILYFLIMNVKNLGNKHIRRDVFNVVTLYSRHSDSSLTFKRQVPT